MVEDKEGFLYPEVDESKCINCGLCEKVCPIINNKERVNNTEAYACINKNENIRVESSSGGIFDLLAKNILDNKGLVIGACFDENLFLIHDVCEEYKDIKKFRGSKYLQSSLKNIYKKVEEVVKEDRDVLFTGTPCQIGGLKVYLGKDYNKLYTQDIICHGVPSQKVFTKYKNHILKTEKIKSINFRDKSSGWNKYSLIINDYKNTNLEDPYMRLFIKNKDLRYSCYNCAYKGKNKQSDITLGDFWGIDEILPNFNDNKGVSLVIINTKKGEELFKLINKDLIYKEVDFNKAIEKNEAYSVSAREPNTRSNFYKDLDKMSFDKLYKKHYNNKQNVLKRILRKIFK